MSRAYYNEFDPKAAATLRELIREGLIAPGDVDERSIDDVLPSELAGYTQCHFFAGFGIWSLALRQAGWSDNRPVWTGSCPCQPFSAAGKGAGFDDERHLWPAFFHLIQHGKRPDVPIYGEQVASPDALAWLDIVCTDLEATNHTVRALDLCAAGFGAPIIRQRLFWLARATSGGHKQRLGSASAAGEGSSRGELERLCDAGELGSANCSIAQQFEGSRTRSVETAGSGSCGESDRSSDISGLAGTSNDGLDRSQATSPVAIRDGQDGRVFERSGDATGGGLPSPTNGFWGVADWLRCRDDKWRPVEPGTFPLAHGYPERVGILRGAGNAISPEVAKAFIEVTMNWSEQA